MKTIKEFCEMFKISRQTFYKWRKAGKIKVVKVDRAVRIEESEIKRFKKNNLR